VKRAGYAPAPMPSKLFQPGLLKGRVAVVSGGGSGLGRASALELAALGAQVVVCGRRAEPLDETAAQADGGRVEACTCDIREESQVEALVDGVLGRHGRIDLLVNNAGGQYLTPAEEITPKGFRTVMRLNVEGTWLMTHAVATKAMMGGPGTEPRGGKIVNVTLSPHHGLPGMAHSSAARAAVENLTRVLSIEWARFGIRLTALAAGHFATETLRTKYPKQVVEGVAGTVPLGRLGTEEEFAWLVAYLATPAGDYFSGAVLTLDGARGNWLGPWPPGGLVDDQGRPLAEQRQPKQ
jgi:citronellol/citronellal dehydrogenase